MSNAYPCRAVMPRCLAIVWLSVAAPAAARQVEPEDRGTVNEVMNDVDATGIGPREDHRIVPSFGARTSSRASIQASAITSRK